MWRIRNQVLEKGVKWGSTVKEDGLFVGMYVSKGCCVLGNKLISKMRRNHPWIL
jgi:hypothetical protein